VVHSLPLSPKSELYPSDLAVKGTLALNNDPQHEGEKLNTELSGRSIFE